MTNTTLHKTKLIALLLFSCLLPVMAQQVPANKTTEPILLANATIHVGNGSIIEKGFVRIHDGKITYVGNQQPVAVQNEMLVDLSGQHIYPSFIMPNSNLGLVEIEAVRATRDFYETGDLNPNVRSLIAYNAESKILETTKTNGVLLAQITPMGSRLAGQSSIVQLDAWNWQDAVVKMDDAMHLYWNEYNLDPNDKEVDKKKADYEKSFDELEQFFLQAKNYNAKTQTYNPKYESLQKVFTEAKPLFIHVNFALDMLKAISFKKKFNIPKVVFVGAYDAIEIAEQLKENDIALLVTNVHELPFRDDDDIVYAYTLPIKLVEKGLLVGLEISGDRMLLNARNLPFHAGTLVGYGMEKEKALQLITLNTAKILGIDNAYGSIETGKSATLFVSTGDALDPRTNNLSHAFIDGRKISLGSFQKDLYNKYRNKQVVKKE